jgi:radical SAM superfamily enzyme YgiQ (UPF0313 family)/2-polyprenyl-3-methyl-5-hydroxy-6-metoxy-1,4-benzoquinol methylase
MVCLGEGETTLLSLVKNLKEGRDFKNIPGLGYKINGKGVINEQNSLISELDLLPLPDYTCENDYLLQEGSVRKIDKSLLEDILTSHTHTSRQKYKIYHTITSRGCNFACAYCCNSYLNKMRSGQKGIRKRGVENIINEFTAVKRELPFIDCILINDDDFFFRSAEEIALFAKEYKEKISLPLWITGLNISEFNNVKFSSLVDAGLKFVRLGIQSGSARIRKLYNRHYSNCQVQAVAKEINKFRDRIAAPSYDIILDNPWETEDDLTQTLMLISSLPRPYSIQLYSLTFYPGTQLYDRAKREGIIKNDIEEVYNRSYYAVKPSYLNKLFQLLSAYARNEWFIPPMGMVILTNQTLRRLKISCILYYALKIFILYANRFIYYSKHFSEILPVIDQKLNKLFLRKNGSSERTEDRATNTQRGVMLSGYQWCVSQIKDISGYRILDAACGMGYGTDRLAQNSKEATGIDISLSSVEYCRRHYRRDNLSFLQMDCADLKFADNYFDAVISQDTIEHIQDDKAFLKQIKRVLKPGGVCFIFTPHSLFDNANPDNRYHIREYGEKSFSSLLKEYFTGIEIFGRKRGTRLVKLEDDLDKVRRYDKFGLRRGIPAGIRHWLAKGIAAVNRDIELDRITCDDIEYFSGTDGADTMIGVCRNEK